MIAEVVINSNDNNVVIYDQHGTIIYERNLLWEERWYKSKLQLLRKRVKDRNWWYGSHNNEITEEEFWEENS